MEKILKEKSGFTLIELLVVISIIGVLSTIVLSSISGARTRAQDAKKITQIKQIQTALEIYNLNNGGYPGVNGDMYYYSFTEEDRLCGHVGPAEGAWCRFENVLSDYIPELPRAETDVTREYLYKYVNGGQDYGLMVKLDSDSNPAALNDGGYADDYFEVGSIIGCGNWLTWSTLDPC